VLGICYGQQTMMQQLGGKVVAGDAHLAEFGAADMRIAAESPLLHGLGEIGHVERVWMSHGDAVTALPLGFETLATSEGAPYAVVADEGRRFYGVQFHPEAAHTPRGALILRNFTHRIAGLTGDWTMASFRDEQVRKIREQVGAGRVICGLSGGVDSSVAAVLIHEAIGEQLTCVFVDTGLLRAGEGDQVVELFRNHYNIPLIHVQAQDEFLGRPRRRQRAGSQAQGHRQDLHRRLRPRGVQDRRRRVPRPGHPLPRRGGERVGPRRPLAV
jgi:GMP synthase (glutamine-hydrolysing)